MTTAINNPRSVGIATVVSSKNFYSSDYTDGIGWPACISTAISVGGTYGVSLDGKPVDTIFGFSGSNLSPRAPAKADANP